MKPVDAPSAWSSPSDLDRKESNGRNSPHGVAPHAHRSNFSAQLYTTYSNFTAYWWRHMSSVFIVFNQNRSQSFQSKIHNHWKTKTTSELFMTRFFLLSKYRNFQILIIQTHLVFLRLDRKENEVFYKCTFCLITWREIYFIYVTRYIRWRYEIVMVNTWCMGSRLPQNSEGSASLSLEKNWKMKPIFLHMNII